MLDAGHGGTTRFVVVVVFAGGSNLGFVHGQYRQYDENKTPLSNLFVTLLDRMGTNATTFKDSHGSLSEIMRG